MNRYIVSVIIGAFGTKASGGSEAMKFEGETTLTNVEDLLQREIQQFCSKPDSTVRLITSTLVLDGTVLLHQMQYSVQ